MTGLDHFSPPPRQHLAMTIDDRGFLTLYRDGQPVLATQALKPAEKIRTLNCHAVDKLIIDRRLPSPDGIKMMASGVNPLVRIGSWQNPHRVYANDWPDSLELDDGVLDGKEFILKQLESGYALLQRAVPGHQYVIDEKSAIYRFADDGTGNSGQWFLSNTTGTADQLEVVTHPCQKLHYQKAGGDLILTILTNDGLLKHGENSTKPINSTQSLRVPNFFSKEGET
ncbi:hypothetical protein, partial [Endozoicomonas sp. SESOKO2]|uniref:hypothetical protein n=1 Tax=Endozoicomonas sp. SESOKO2 TaxID=2828743 RepID=UPI002147927E